MVQVTEKCEKNCLTVLKAIRRSKVLPASIKSAAVTFVVEYHTKDQWTQIKDILQLAPSKNIEPYWNDICKLLRTL